MHRVGSDSREDFAQLFGWDRIRRVKLHLDPVIGRLDVTVRRRALGCNYGRFDAEPSATPRDASRGLSASEDQDLVEHGPSIATGSTSASRSSRLTGADRGGRTLTMLVSIRSSGLARRSVRHDSLRWRAEAMLDALGLEGAELSILLCDDQTIRKLNRRYRKKDKATDVLAFPMREGLGPSVDGGLLGDVAISVPMASRQAAQRDRPIIDEVTFLLAHGLLHLLGYDHANERDEREMTARTEELMASVRAARA